MPAQIAKAILVVMMLFAGAAMYFLPIIIGISSRHRQRVVMAGLLLGWTLLCFIGAMIWVSTN